MQQLTVGQEGIGLIELDAAHVLQDHIRRTARHVRHLEVWEAFYMVNRRRRSSGPFFPSELAAVRCDHDLFALNQKTQTIFPPPGTIRVT
jgi:hypothetical protein